jgi:hypothetical protein
MEEIITEVEKGRDEVIRVGVSEYEGHDFAQVRVWYEKDGDWRPTKKGVTFNAKNIDQVIEGLRGAKEKLLERAAAKREKAAAEAEDKAEEEPVAASVQTDNGTV